MQQDKLLSISIDVAFKKPFMFKRRNSLKITILSHNVYYVKSQSTSKSRSRPAQN